MSPALPSDREGAGRKEGVSVLVASGASGGHIFPAIAFIEALKASRRDIRVGLLLPRRNFLSQEKLPPCRVDYLPVRAFKRDDPASLPARLFDFLRSVFKTFFIILEEKPACIVGFGSIASVPAVILGWLFRAKTLIHEQNVVPGEANKFLARFADTIAVTFAETSAYLPGSKNKIVLTGNPVRRELKKFSKEEAARFFGLNPGYATLLVMGGSQGSRSLNHNFIEALSASGRPDNLQVIHLAGAESAERIKEKYLAMAVEARVFPFLNEMAYAYSLSDILVARAGATTIAEACFYGLPAIFLPYPFARRHQSENARFLEAKGCAIVIEEDSRCAVSLREAMDSIINDPLKISRIRNNYGRMSYPDAAGGLASCVLNGFS